MLSDLVRCILARWPIVCICLLASLIGGVVMATRMPPRYSAYADVLMELVKPDAQTGEMIPTRLIQDYVGTQMRLAASPETTKYMIKQFGWLQDPVLQAEYQRVNARVSMESWLAGRLAQAVAASVPDGTNILRLTYSAPDPDNARVLAGALRSAFLAGAVDRKVREARKSFESLDRQARAALDRYSSALDERNRYAASRGIVLQQNIAEEKRLANALLDRGTSLDMLSRGRPVSPQSAPTAGSWRALRMQGRLDVSAAAGGQRTADDPAGSATVPIARSPALSRGDMHFETLRQQADIAYEAYMATIGRRESARRDTNTADSNLSAFGDPEVSDEASFPKYPNIIAASLALGLIIGVEVALLAELLDKRVRADLELEAASGVETLAVVRNGVLQRSSKSLQRFMQYIGNRLWKRAEEPEAFLQA